MHGLRCMCKVDVASRAPCFCGLSSPREVVEQRPHPFPRKRAEAYGAGAVGFLPGARGQSGRAEQLLGGQRGITAVRVRRTGGRRRSRLRPPGRSRSGPGRFLSAGERGGAPARSARRSRRSARGPAGRRVAPAGSAPRRSSARRAALFGHHVGVGVEADRRVVAELRGDVDDREPALVDQQ